MADKPTIVVGVSARSGSPAALRWAADEAKKRRARVVAVRAWRTPRPPTAPGGRPPAVSDDAPGSQAAAQAKLAEAVTAALGADHDVECRVVHGSPAQVLLAEAGDAVLLVLDAPRPANVKETTYVAYRLFNRAPCPVVVMPTELVRT